MSDMEYSLSPRICEVSSSYAIDCEFEREFEERSSLYVPNADRMLCSEGDAPESVYLLRRGESLLTVADRSLPFLRVGPQSLIGLSAVFFNRPHGVTATGSEDAEGRGVRREVFLELVESRPQLYLSALRVLAAEIDAAFRALAEAVA